MNIIDLFDRGAHKKSAIQSRGRQKKEDVRSEKNVKTKEKQSTRLFFLCLWRVKKEHIRRQKEQLCELFSLLKNSSIRLFQHFFPTSLETHVVVLWRKLKGIRDFERINIESIQICICFKLPQRGGEGGISIVATRNKMTF